MSTELKLAKTLRLLFFVNSIITLLSLAWLVANAIPWVQKQIPVALLLSGDAIAIFFDLSHLVIMFFVMRKEINTKSWMNIEDFVTHKYHLTKKANKSLHLKTLSKLIFTYYIITTFSYILTALSSVFDFSSIHDFINIMPTVAIIIVFIRFFVNRKANKLVKAMYNHLNNFINK